MVLRAMFSLLVLILSIQLVMTAAAAASAPVPVFLWRPSHSLLAVRQRQDDAHLQPSSRRRCACRRRFRTCTSSSSDAVMVLLASSRKTTSSRQKNNSKSSKNTKQQQQQQSSPKDSTSSSSKSSLESQNPEIPTYQELGLAGKVVVGSLQIVVTTAVEYGTGFLGGYLLGAVVGVPGLFRPTREVMMMAQQQSTRLGRWHAKAMRWGTTWAPISAVYGGCDAATRVIRGGNKKDQWNVVISSAAAGAFFSRAGGPQAMLRGAALYGGITYLLSGGGSNKRQEFQYQEEALEF